ncbi:toll/interleukin-1 receptor domain-containing protein [Citricoccus sp. NR2]|uniref:toll/interleukin-1 receptor domain-containing protein n=1 Tax=Citricoccus sp. NR2 TaxID=3004095 RepID=UPI0022DD08B6|nr:toll/interleukin-1 receptor domain-containing protein [Citricoccus sp. NR2]WBL18065.1 toll/interleukin-1 receptor domain-containing protein [Citricoccus sp. NR2]
MPERGYEAFISYSHTADGALAPAIQTGMQQLGRSWRERRAMDVFRDETGLAVDPNLWGAITRALDDSQWFILLASPLAAQSQWVGKEIQHCVATKGSQRILIVLTEGTLDWDAERRAFAEDSTALHPALVGLLHDEPLIIDLTWARTETQLTIDNPRFRAAITQIVSHIRGQSVDAVAKSAAQQQRRTKRIVAAALATLTMAAITASTSAIIAGANWLTAAEDQRSAEDEARHALAREFAALVQGAEDPRAALALASEAYTLSPSTEMLGPLLTAVTGPGAELTQLPQLLPDGFEIDDIRSSSGPLEHSRGRIALDTSRGATVIDVDSGDEWRLPGTFHYLTPDGSRAIGTDGTVVELLDNGEVNNQAVLPALSTPPSFDQNSELIAYRHDGPGSSFLVVADVSGEVIRETPTASGASCIGCFEDASVFALAPDGRHVAARLARPSMRDSTTARLSTYAVEEDSLRELATETLSGTGGVRFSDDSTSLWVRDGGQMLVLDPQNLDEVSNSMHIARAGPLRFADDTRAIAPADACQAPGVVLSPTMATVTTFPETFSYSEAGCMEDSPPGVEPRWLLGGTWLQTAAGVWPASPELLLDLICAGHGGPLAPDEFAELTGIDHTPRACTSATEES